MIAKNFPKELKNKKKISISLSRPRLYPDGSIIRCSYRGQGIKNFMQSDVK